MLHFQDLVARLEWLPHALGEADVEGEHARLLEARLDQVLRTAIHERVAGADAARLALGALDRPAVDRLIRAPETSNRVLHRAPDSNTVQFLLEAAQAEFRDHSSLPVPLWTALGDRYFPASIGSVGGAAGVDGPFEFDQHRAYVAPVLGSIVVDPLSPYTRTIHGPPGFQESPPTPLEARHAYAKLEAAMGWIGRVDSSVAAFVDRGIATLVLRNQASADLVGSSSTPEYAGRAVIWNAHLDAADVALLAEELVHEAIHCHAYRLERTLPFLAAPPPEGRRVRSPWSGRLLPVATYLHACLVWYGLANFWLLALEREAVPARDAFARLFVAASGFAQDLVEPLGDARDAVVPALLEVVSQLQATMRRRAKENAWLAMIRR